MIKNKPNRKTRSEHTDITIRMFYIIPFHLSHHCL